jgi:hypothetical protein
MMCHARRAHLKQTFTEECPVQLQECTIKDEYSGTKFPVAIHSSSNLDFVSHCLDLKDELERIRL